MNRRQLLLGSTAVAASAAVPIAAASHVYGASPGAAAAFDADKLLRMIQTAHAEAFSDFLISGHCAVLITGGDEDPLVVRRVDPREYLRG